jgi:putative hydrolase of HD superfamily
MEPQGTMLFFLIGIFLIKKKASRKGEMKMDQQRLDQQFDFIMEIDKEKLIGRQTYLSDGVRKENDAEHAWHMAIMTLLLSEYANEKIDVLKTISMLLIHDLVEIDAGDTYAYDEEGKKTQQERESKAADRIFGLLPEDQQVKLRSLWEEFEARETPEAKFARVMDNLQPMMLNAATDGKAWEEHQVQLAQILARNEHTAEGSKELWEYAYQNFLLPNVAKGKIRE